MLEVLMSRSKKSRRLKSIVSVKTGSKSELIEQSGKKGQIASKNKLSKHKKRQKSAFAKSQAQSTESSSGLKSNQTRHKNVSKQPNNSQQLPQLKPQQKTIDPVSQPASKADNVNFNELDGDQLLDFFENN